MADAYTTFYSADMVAAVGMLERLRSLAASVRPDVAAEVAVTLGSLQADLAILSERTAQLADARIRDRIHATAAPGREQTNRPHHLADSIKSDPLPGGGVAIALLDELNALENPETGGVYWLAQEEGSVAVGNVMTGRVIFGEFFGRAGARRPTAGARGPESTFVSARYGAAVDPGFGTIQHEIEPRHFLRDGSLEAFGVYREGVRHLSRRYAQRVAAIAVFSAA